MEKALTIKNPWAYLIATGTKTVENRSRRTHYRGKVLLHSSKQMDNRYRDMSTMFTYDQWLALTLQQQEKCVSGILHMSAIIGEAEIVDCIENSKSVWAEPGQWHWIIKNAVMYEKPILNVKGQLGIWNCTDRRYARLIGFTDNSDDIDFIERVIEKNLHIEWKNDDKNVYYIYLTKEEFDTQMKSIHRTWCCPKTGLGDGFDDEYFQSTHAKSQIK